MSQLTRPSDERLVFLVKMVQPVNHGKSFCLGKKDGIVINVDHSSRTVNLVAGDLGTNQRGRVYKKLKKDFRWIAGWKVQVSERWYTLEEYRQKNKGKIIQLFGEGL